MRCWLVLVERRERVAWGMRVVRAAHLARVSAEDAEDARGVADALNVWEVGEIGRHCVLSSVVVVRS